MKPVFLNHLFQHEMVRKAIYVDPDIYFFNQFKFLFQELDSASVLLTPHWRSSDPVVDAENFEKNFTEGLFNGGFIGATEEAANTLDWWARACLYECVQVRNRGLYDDQKYLDMMPVFFERVKVLRHRGCNVAEWNAIECKREIAETGEVLINDKYPVVFMHFTPWLYHRILHENDFLLKPYMERQVAALRKYKADFKVPSVNAASIPPISGNQPGILEKLWRRGQRLKAKY
jgi:hypothetical protein